MKNLSAKFAIAALSLFLTTSLTFAKPPEHAQNEHNTQNSKPNKQNQEVTQTSENNTQNNNATNGAQICDPGATWKNHGAYVSCVARNIPGPHRLGGPGNSVAARSNVGKPGFVPPSATGPAEPPNGTDSAEPPDATDSATNSATPSATTQGPTTVVPLAAVIALFEAIIEFLKGLL